jgi:thiol-disulfide isomerase/thioredoxin
MKVIIIHSFIILFFLLKVQAQEFNKTFFEEEIEETILIDNCNRSGLKGEVFGAYFSYEYSDYEPGKKLLKKLSKHTKDLKIKIVLGTWCGDSKRESPKFIKILEAADFPMEQLEIIALDYRKGHYKTSPTEEEKGLNIIKVPTIIFFKDGKEVNRIVESPLETLEEDMAQILFEKDYVPNYAY